MNKSKMTFVLEYDAKAGKELIGKLMQSMIEGADTMGVRVTEASMGDDIERLERYEDLYEAQCSVDGVHSDTDQITKLEADKAELIYMLNKTYEAVRANYKQGGDCDYWSDFNKLLERMK